MLRIITSDDTKFGQRINGNFALVYFCATGLSAGTGNNIIYFKFEDEIKTELVGNGHFTADGYLYDIFNNTTSNFTYKPTIKMEVQKLQFRNVKNVNISFFDKDENAINIPNWTLILKQL